MKAIRFLVALLLFAAPAWAAPAYVAGSVAETIADLSLATISVTLGAAVSVGDYIVGMAGASSDGNPITAVVDTSLNTYTIQSNATVDTTNAQFGQTFFARVTTSGTPTVTVTFTITPNSRRVIVAAYSGLANPAVDGTAGNWQSAPGTGANAVTSTAITPSQDGDLIMGYTQDSGGGGNISAGTNFTGRNALEAILRLEDLVQGTAASIAATFTQAAPDGAKITHIVAFKAAAAAGGTPQRTLIGVGQ